MRTLTSCMLCFKDTRNRGAKTRTQYAMPRDSDEEGGTVADSDPDSEEEMLLPDPSIQWRLPGF